ncbi:MAG: ChaN family lipoprotein [Acidobacteriota bacterium]|nr:ChaN family lipoprotein [Acidobacteriota bacterium]
MNRIAVVAFIIFVIIPVFSDAVPAGQQDPGKPGEDPILTLELGDPMFRGQFVSAAPGEIISAKAGGAVDFDSMIRDMADSRFVHVGETHNSLPMHEVQLRVLQGLYAQDPHIALGLEMFPSTLQPVLDRFNAGEFDLEEFVRAVRWYETWNFNFGYYRDIFAFALEKGIPVHGINTPREIISRIRMKGWASLEDEEKALVPEPDLSNEDHRTLVRAIFESLDLPPQMKGGGLDMVFEGLYRSQAAWDEVMATAAVRAAEKDGRRMVVLAGSGHLLYNLGLNRRAFEKTGQPFLTVVCVPVPDGQPSVRVARGLADFIWGIAAEKRPAYPDVGLTLRKIDGLDNLVVDPQPSSGVARGAAFVKGDVILDADGLTFNDINELRIYLARFDWGEEAHFRVLRNARVENVTLHFEMPVEKEEE